MQIEGRNAVLEALNHNSTIDKIFVKSGELEGSLKVIVKMASDANIVIQYSDKRKLDSMSENGKHQGVIALCPEHAYVDVSDILQIAHDKDEHPFIIILDGITDPHNLGAIIRTADACGAHGIIIPKRRSATLTSTVSKTSAGAIQHVPVAKVTNLSRTIEDLKKNNVWVVSSDMQGDVMYNSSLVGAIALVIGSEGEGISRLVKEKCDFHIKIPMYGQISSLNASVAAALTMYEVVRQRQFA